MFQLHQPLESVMDAKGVTTSDNIDVSKGGVRHTLTEILDELDNEVTIDASISLLKVKLGNDTYVCNVELLQNPATPYCDDESEYDTTSNYVDITLKCSTAGATIHYTLDSSDPRLTATAPTGTVVRLSGILDVEEKEFTVNAAARRNGLWSGLFVGIFTFHRKVATPVISADGNDYSTSRTVTITCDTPGTTIHYTTNNSPASTSSPTYNPSNKPKLTSSSTVNAIATRNEWVTSGNAQAKEYTVGAKKTYYGASDKETLESSADIIALATTGGGGSIDRSGLEPNKLYTINGTAGKYIWICCTTPIDNVKKIYDDPSSVIDFGFIQTPVEIDDWYCYRSEEITRDTLNSVNIIYINK